MGLLALLLQLAWRLRDDRGVGGRCMLLIVDMKNLVSPCSNPDSRRRRSVTLVPAAGAYDA